MSRKERRRAEKRGRKGLMTPAAAADAERRLRRAVEDFHAGRLQAAEKTLIGLQGIQPGVPDVLHLLGLIALQTNRPAAAVVHLRKALKAKPDSAELHKQLAAALWQSGAKGKAVAAAERAAAIAPGDADVLTSLGNLFAKSGRLDDAEGAYRRALHANPSRVLPYANIAHLKTYTEAGDDAAAIEDALAAAGLVDKDAITLNLTLGKIYDDVGEHDKAFAALEVGNSIKKRTTNYDIDAAEALMESALQVFDQPLLDELRGNGSPSDGPIFVLGMPRSSTTLVEQILSSHSRVYGAGELNEMRELVWRHLAAGANRQARCFVAGDITPGLLNKLGPSYAEAITRYAPDSPRIVDKMPLNFIYIGVIALALPNARIVHCIRDPVDTCLSCYMKIFNDAELNYSYDLNHLGRYFAAYTRLMDHWRRLLPGRMVELRYEALVAEQERETRRLLDACGLEWEDGCLRFYKTERQVETASIMQVRQPIYDHAIQRWRHYEGHLGPLLVALGLSKDWV
ncbi:MAG: sulfotransferase [Rhodospirillales bacterium]